MEQTHLLRLCIKDLRKEKRKREEKRRLREEKWERERTATAIFDELL